MVLVGTDAVKPGLCRKLKFIQRPVVVLGGLVGVRHLRKRQGEPGRGVILSQTPPAVPDTA